MHPGALPIDRVVDGDTVVINIAPPLPRPLGASLKLRIRGVDCPELRTPRCEEERVRAVAARDFTAARLRDAGGGVAVRLCHWPGHHHDGWWPASGISTVRASRAMWSSATAPPWVTDRVSSEAWHSIMRIDRTAPWRPTPRGGTRAPVHRPRPAAPMVFSRG